MIRATGSIHQQRYLQSVQTQPQPLSPSERDPRAPQLEIDDPVVELKALLLPPGRQSVSGAVLTPRPHRESTALPPRAPSSSYTQLTELVLPIHSTLLYLSLSLPVYPLPAF